MGCDRIGYDKVQLPVEGGHHPHHVRLRRQVLVDQHLLPVSLRSSPNGCIVTLSVGLSTVNSHIVTFWGHLAGHLRDCASCGSHSLASTAVSYGPMRLPSDTVRSVQGYPDGPVVLAGQMLPHIKSHLEAPGRPFLPVEHLSGQYCALSGRRKDNQKIF